MVVRMRIYKTVDRQPSSDLIFYDLVKPVHEKHGARFMGRYLDQNGQYVVLWQYSSEEEMVSIQQAVANDPETIATKEIRQKSGLHGVPFDEFMLKSTDPDVFPAPKSL
jgi:hypothetical protein